MVTVTTVLCKSKASEMRKFCFLFSRTFNEISCESLNDNSRLFERIFPLNNEFYFVEFWLRNESSAKFCDKKRWFTARCSNFALDRLNCLPCDLRDLSFI